MDKPSREKVTKKQYTKLVVWDFDDTLSETHNQNWNDPDTYQYEKKTTAITIEESFQEASQAQFSGNEFDVYIPKISAVTVTLDILKQNDVLSVIGSQRILCEAENNKYDEQIHCEAMYESLDGAFGKDRAYLKKEDAQQCAKNFKSSADKMNASKNSLLEKYQTTFEMKAENVFLVDDNPKYEDPVVTANYQFVLAKPANTNIGSDHLYEVLFRTIPINNIHQSIMNVNVSEDGRIAYTNDLLSYELRNIEFVSNWQQKLTPDINKKQGVERTLQSIKQLILSNQWNTGYGGAVVFDEDHKLRKVIPKGMKRILNIIDNKSLPFDQKILDIQTSLDQSLNERDANLSCFKRGETTVTFYKELLNTLKPSSGAPNLDVSESSSKFKK